MSHSRPTTESSSEDESGSADVMSFKVDILEEDVPARIEDMMRLSALGFFREALDQSHDLFSRKEDVFAVKMEFMRLLFEQGDFEGLLNYIRRQTWVSALSTTYRYSLDDIRRHLTSGHGGTGPARSSSEIDDDVNTQHMIIYQMRRLSMLSREETGLVARDGKSALDYRISSSAIEKCMDQPLQSVIFVLALYISDITRQLWFHPTVKIEPVRTLFGKQNYWAAENVLKFSLRILNFETAPGDEDRTVSEIARQVGLTLESKALDDGEINLLAKINLLQTFFEGYVDGTFARSTGAGIEAFRGLLDQASKYERAILAFIPPTSWEATRTRIRRELLAHDMSFTGLNQHQILSGNTWNEDLINSDKALRTLKELKQSAANNHDLRCVRGIDLRQAVADGRQVEGTWSSALAFIPDLYRDHLMRDYPSDSMGVGPGRVTRWFGDVKLPETPSKVDVVEPRLTRVVRRDNAIQPGSVTGKESRPRSPFFKRRSSQPRDSRAAGKEHVSAGLNKTLSDSTVTSIPAADWTRLYMCQTDTSTISLTADGSHLYYSQGLREARTANPFSGSVSRKYFSVDGSSITLSPWGRTDYDDGAGTRSSFYPSWAQHREGWYAHVPASSVMAQGSGLESRQSREARHGRYSPLEGTSRQDRARADDDDEADPYDLIKRYWL